MGGEEATKSMNASASFFLQREDLKQAIADAQTGGQDVALVLERVWPKLRDDALRREFFGMLTLSIWLEPLDRAGAFDSPEAPETVAGGIRHPFWPASQYLVRMASIAPIKVASILARIQTDNSSVLSDIVDAVTRMPPQVAATLIPCVCQAIQADVFERTFPKATDFCVQLASGGQEDAAMTLAEALFGSEHQPGEGTAGSRERYWYEEGMKKIVPVLTEKRPTEFIHSLCRWLGEAIKQERHYTGPRNRGESSWYWRPAIEEHEQNRDHDFPCRVVGFVRQAFEQAIGSGEMTLQDGLAIIERQPFSVFKRLHIHLVNHFAEQAPELARSTIMADRATLEDDECRHEYAVLVGERFSMLSQEEQDVWLGWVEAGPDMGWYDEYHKKHSANPESLASDRARHVRQWQFERLHWARRHLEGKWRSFYEEMLAKFGEPLHADFGSYHGPVRWGLDSPFKTEELSALPFAQVVQKIDSWEPGQTRRGFLRDPQKEGLAGTFGQFVAAKAVEFSAQAAMLEGCQPIYVRTFIERMTDAAKAESIDVGAVLRLCTWVVEQPIGRDARADEGSWDMVDRGWRYTRDSICRFLETICQRATNEGEAYGLLEFREKVVALLDPLLRDSARSYLVDDTERTNVRLYDFLTSAINSPRGKAMEVLIAYARWIANHVQQEQSGRTVVPNGFGAMPEVQRMLEWQVAPENACFESFAVIGTYIGLLRWIDEVWVDDKVSRIFDLTMIEQDPMCSYGWAAWNAFLVWGSASLVFYRLLRAQYIYAVQSVSRAVVPESAGKTPVHHLGEHLILLYGRGDLAGCGDEWLLEQFLEAASNDVRSQTIAFVGQSLYDSENVPEQVVQRFERLWDRYWPKFGRLDAKTRSPSGLFGWWFASKKFPDQWCLERLEQYIQVLPIPESAERIVERLTELAGSHIEAVTGILDRMIRADEEGWRAYAWRGAATEILAIALCGNDIVRSRAIRLIDDLGRRGYLEFGKLLQPSADAGK